MPCELICQEPEKLEWREYEEPELGENEVRIRCEYAAAKHGTEMAFYDGHGAQRGKLDPELGLFRSGEPHLSCPAALGNMAVGSVVETGDQVSTLKKGDRVCTYASFRNTTVSAEKNCRKMPDYLSWKSAVCLDPADFALASVRDGQIRVGDSVAVFGLGAIGLMTVQLAALSGAEPIVGIDPIPNRRSVAEEVGASWTLDPDEAEVGYEIKCATEKRGVDVALDYSGSAQALQLAIASVAFGGNVVAGSFPPPYKEGIDLGAEAHFNRPNLIFSRACSDPNRDHPRWNNQRIYDTCWRFILDGKLQGDPVVQPVVDFDELKEAYGRVVPDPRAGIKLGVTFESQ